MNRILSVKEVKVGIDFGGGVAAIGRLAIHKGDIYFEYCQNFIDQGLEISPRYLPLKSGLIRFDKNLFEGLPGVFNDSLPDGWGRLLFDRFALSQDVLPAEISPLDRLASVGQQGMGALVYEPDYSIDKTQDDICLNILATQAQDVLDGVSDDVLEVLMALNGSSAGARPKALIGVSDLRDHIIFGSYDLRDGYTPWMVKFPNSQDGRDAGAIEYIYALMAKEAGIEMPDVHLFPAQKGAGYFATKRFDRDDKRRYHMHSACGLLHADFRAPSLDYRDLIALTYRLTRDAREGEKIYRLAVFNVLAHNRDDHAKNFSFLMDQNGEWKLSPAYDLTFSSGPGGEQSTMVMGEGRNPSVEHLLTLGEKVGIAKSCIDDIIAATKSSLAKWQYLANTYGVSQANIKLIGKKIS